MRNMSLTNSHIILLSSKKAYAAMFSVQLSLFPLCAAGTFEAGDQFQPTLTQGMQVSGSLHFHGRCKFRGTTSKTETTEHSFEI